MKVSRTLHRAYTCARLVFGCDFITISDTMWSRRLQTSGLDMSSETLAQLGTHASRSTRHDASPMLPLLRIARKLGVASKDGVIDLGCGKGAALFAFKRAGAGRVAGLDISGGLIECARRNLEAGRVDGISLICQDAGTFIHYDNYNYMYLFNPFPACVLNEVMNNLKISLRRTPRRMRILYANPFHQEVITKSGLFREELRYDYCQGLIVSSNCTAGRD